MSSDDAVRRLDAQVAPVRDRFLRRHAAREEALAKSRDAIRQAANAIRAVHRGDVDRADDLLSQARATLGQAAAAVAEHPELAHAGFLQDGAKEVAEAACTRAAVLGEPLPGPADLAADGVDDGSWLHGLAETVGECRRACLDRIRAEDLDEAERLLSFMDEVLAVLATIDVPDGLTRGLRRSADAARAITERTRGDLTAAVGQRRLRAALDAHRASMEG